MKIDPRLEEMAVNFLKLVVEGKIDEAYANYVNIVGKHHNVFFEAGFLSLLEAMKSNQDQYPAKKFVVKHVIGENDLVVVHSQLTMDASSPAFIAVHILRFEKNKIIEMWDVSQKVPNDSPNKDGAF
jgi:predicted SnoaL-like aldol condensation-catalyzing enzyme